MAGNPNKASLWTDADVYLNTSLSAFIPTDGATAFATGWDLVGLLDGDDGFTDSRDEDTEVKYAWGGIAVRTSRKNFVFTRAFTPIEDNATTRKLVWPGSSATQLVVPRPAKVKLAFEVREGLKVLRLITRNYADVAPSGDITYNEGDLTKYPLVATVYPDGDGVLFDRQEVDSTGAIVTV